MFQKASKSVCTSNVVVSPDHFLPAPSTSPAVKTLITPNQQMKEISKWNSPLINYTAQVWKQLLAIT
jgi:hypothetical protein